MIVSNDHLTNKKWIVTDNTTRRRYNIVGRAFVSCDLSIRQSEYYCLILLYYYYTLYIVIDCVVIDYKVL